MKCLTVHEPWASGIIFGTKRVENRSRPIAYRGELLIHAGLSRSRIPGLDVRDPVLRRLLPDLRSLGEFRFGQVIGVVSVVGCLTGEQARGEGYDWSEGPYCWLLDDPRPVEPFPWVGQQGMAEVPDELVRYL
jgi:hypothetical protein